MELSTQNEITLGIPPQVLEHQRTALVEPDIRTREELLIVFLRRWSVLTLRVALGLVFAWFGFLKLFGVSPVIPMLRQTYAFLPVPLFGLLLGVWEMSVGTALIFKLALRLTLVLLCLHLLGTFMALWLAPHVFFLNGNPLLLTANGEFVIKNLVLVTAGLVIAGHEVVPMGRSG